MVGPILYCGTKDPELTRDLRDARRGPPQSIQPYARSTIAGEFAHPHKRLGQVRSHDCFSRRNFGEQFVWEAISE